MWIVIAGIVIVWIVASCGISVMKKICPEDKIYPFWAIFVAALLTLCFIPMLI